MSGKMLTSLLPFCLVAMILTLGGLSAEAKSRSQTTSVRSVSNLVLTCDDIDPECGDACLVIQHDQVGDTWYDFQKNGSVGRMISVTSSGYRHFSWTFTDGPFQASNYRYVDANCKNPMGIYLGQGHISGGEAKNAGYINQHHMSDERSVVTYHRTAGQVGDPVTHSMLSMEDAVCTRLFTSHWDIPDSILGATSGEKGLWPKLAVKYDSYDEKDYIHVVVTEGRTPYGYTQKGGPGNPSEVPHYVPVMVAYVRCHLDTDPNYLVCESPGAGLKPTYVLYKNTNYSDPANTVSHFDSSCGVTPVVAVSPVSSRVAIAYLPPACDGTCDFLTDVAFIESMNSGNDWIAGTNWPPGSQNITNFGCGGTERAFNDVSACYDYNDSLHILYITTDINYSYPGYRDPHVARLYHWSKESGNTMFTTAIWGGTRPDDHSCNIAKASISAMDPVHHPGGDPDSVFLYCVWTQFDTTTPQDNSDSGYTNGEIYGCGSADGGFSWGDIWNLTQTRTPGCTRGDCASEHWASLAQNISGGRLHIQYVCDKHPGTALPGLDPGSEWQDNGVYYLELEAWEPGARCEGFYTMVDPESFWRPALKVAPGGSRTLILNIRNTGNLPMPYTAVVGSDPPGCVSPHYADILLPGEDQDLYFYVSGAHGSGCDSTFIHGYIDLTMCVETVRITVHAVSADDYYECPIDAETFDTVETDALRIFVNANSREWIHDISSWPDTVHEVFYNGGSIVATSMDNGGVRRAVGRFLGPKDWRAGVQDKLYTEYCQYDDDYDCHVVFTKNIFIHAPPAPPYIHHCYWWWWEWQKQVKVCEIDNSIIVIKYVEVRRHDPPYWWPESDPPQGSYAGHENTYIGMVMDIDCPSEDGVCGNQAGYDDVNHIAWQQGWGDQEHPDYSDYYAGMALADYEGNSANYEPYGAHNVMAGDYANPDGGWNDDSLYALASRQGWTIEHEGLLVDRSQVITARLIPEGEDPEAVASFVMVEAATKNGLAELQALVDTGRAVVVREHLDHGFPVICGDVNGTYTVDLGDAVYILNYLFKEGDEPLCPEQRADVNSNGMVELGDAVHLLNYLFKSGPPPKCSGIW